MSFSGTGCGLPTFCLCFWFWGRYTLTYSGILALKVQVKEQELQETFSIREFPVFPSVVLLPDPKEMGGFVQDYVLFFIPRTNEKRERTVLESHSELVKDLCWPPFWWLFRDHSVYVEHIRYQCFAMTAVILSVNNFPHISNILCLNLASVGWWCQRLVGKMWRAHQETSVWDTMTHIYCVFPHWRPDNETNQSTSCLTYSGNPSEQR